MKKQKENLYIGFYQMVLKDKDGKMYERFTHHMPVPKETLELELDLFRQMAEQEEVVVVMLKKIITGVALDTLESVVMITPSQELQDSGVIVDD